MSRALINSIFKNIKRLQEEQNPPPPPEQPEPEPQDEPMSKEDRSRRFLWGPGDLSPCDDELNEDQQGGGTYELPHLREGYEHLPDGDLSKIKTNIDEHRNRLDDQHIKALTKYKGNYLINRKLRKNENLSSGDQAHVEDLDHVVNNTIPHSLTVYRGFGGNMADEIAKMKPGQVHQDHAYVSTSLSHKIASEFADTPINHPRDAGTRSHRQVIAKIHLPAGSKGYYFDHEDHDLGHEQEFTLPRGSAFRVKSHEHVDYHDPDTKMQRQFHVVHMEAMQK